MVAARTGHWHSEPQPGETLKSFCCGARRLRSLRARSGAEPEPQPLPLPRVSTIWDGGTLELLCPAEPSAEPCPGPSAALTSKAVVDVGEALAGAAACGVFSYLAFQQA